MAGRSGRKIVPLSLANIDDLPSMCRGCTYWVTAEKLPPKCGTPDDPAAKEDWVDSTTSSWGECGDLLYVESDLVAHAIYGPATAFPQTTHFAAGPVSADAVFLSCLLVRDDVRRHGVAKTLLQAVEKSLFTRHAKAIEAFARNPGLDEISALGPVDFYLKNGFYVKHDHPLYPLVRLDLKTAISWQVSLEAMLESLTVPLRPSRAPVPSR